MTTTQQFTGSSGVAELSAEQRFTALARAPRTSLVELAEKALRSGFEVKVINAPRPFIQPLRLSSAPAIGVAEVIITRCDVRAGSAMGFGVRMGHDAQAAFAAAVLDAVCACNGAFAHQVTRLCRRALEEDARQEERLRWLANMTRVD